MRMRLGKARKTYGFMMESLERRELLSGAVDGVLDTAPEAASEIVVAADTTPPPLGAPSAVNITKTFSTSLVVGWTDESASESGSRVERSTDGVLFSTVGTVGPNVTSFQDTGLTPNTPYYYRVVAFDFVGELTSGAIVGSTSSQLLQLGFSDTGLSSINYNGTTLLDISKNQYDGFLVWDYKVIRGDGTTSVRNGLTPSTTSWNPDTHTVTWDFGWWHVDAQYVQNVDRLDLIITLTNESTRWTLAGANIMPFVLQFPEVHDGLLAGTPNLGWNIDGPTVIPADWHNGMLVAVNDDVIKPLAVGFLTSPETDLQNKFMYRIGSTRWWSQPGNWPAFDRRIKPLGTDQYTLSLRFGPSGSTATELAPDIYASALARFPFQLNWADRRPIGAIHLANYVGSGTSVKNPRGYFGGTFDVRTKTGKEAFRTALLQSADQSIKVMKGMNAQGMVVWDLEGEQYHKVAYIGDPRMLSTLAPEMEYRGAVDAYFKRFRSAGLRVGVTVRPQRLKLTSTGWKQMAVKNPYPTLAAKIAYARTRWGATLFYVDSNSGKQLYDASVFKRLADAFPDVLLIPEHENTRYYAYTAPYLELRNQETSTPQSTLVAYPQAFSVNFVPGGDLDGYRAQLVESVRRGDILMFTGWCDDPQNAKVKSIYDEVYPPPPVV